MDIQSNYFKIPNMIFDLDLDISIYAGYIYCYLSRCADDKNQAFPSYNTIANKCKCSQKTAITAIQELEKIGLIKIQKRQKKEKSGKAANTSNLYILNAYPSVPNTEPLLYEIQNPSVSEIEPLLYEIQNPSVSEIDNKDPLINTNDYKDPSINQKDGIDGIDKIGSGDYRDLISKNIEYDLLKVDYPHESLIDDIFELMVEVVNSKRKTMRVASENKSVDIVRSEFLKLNKCHIEYVIECYHKNTEKIGKIDAYIITSLYKAPKTMNAYYTNKVNCDMAN